MRWRLRISRETKRDLVEGSVSLMLCNVGDYISGFYLQYFEPIIRSVPLLLALLPAASDARGDVYSSYGSRLGTLLHLGVFDRYVVVELVALAILVILVNVWVGALLFLIGLAFRGYSLPLSDLAFVSLLSALMSAGFMIPSTTLLALSSFRRGWDPDNVVAPIATLFGDVVTIPTIIVSYSIALHAPVALRIATIIALVSLATAMLIVVAMLKKRNRSFERCLKIVKENLSVIAVSTTFSALAGAVLLANISSVLAWKGIIAVVPAFLEDGGAIACRFSSRLTTMLHLGRVKPSLIPRERWVFTQMGVNYVHALMLFTSLGGFGASMALIAGGSLFDAFRVLAVVELAGFLLTAIVSLLTYFLAVTSYKLGIDPDNVLAPVLTSLADAIGTSSLVLMLMVMGAT